jgi:hypothetical protein
MITVPERRIGTASPFSGQQLSNPFPANV